MYEVDKRDVVLKLKNVPQSDIGAPLPQVIGDEDQVLLAYLVSDVDRAWDGSYVNQVSRDTRRDTIAVVKFLNPTVHMFGPPNDEAFRGHPLASRGLKPYGAFQIEHSSWVRRLERMNSVHPRHNPRTFDAYRHYIFAFHDSTFECVAHGFNIELIAGCMHDALTYMVTALKEE